MEETAIGDVFAERLIDRGISEETARSIAAQLKPCVLLKLRYGWRPWRVKRGTSRFGGWPEVPRDFVWPQSRYHERWGTRPNGGRYQLRESGGNPLTFIAQLNLADVHAHLPEAGLLPENGLLSIFYDRHEMPLGDDRDDPSGWRVFHFEEVEHLSQRAAPRNAAAALKSCPMKPRRWMSLPAHLSQIAGTDALGDRQWADVLDEAQKLDLDGAQYRMFGHAGAIKEAMEPEAERIRRGLSKDDLTRWTATESDAFHDESRKNWRLLVQFPTDFRANVDWCEAGTLFVWMRNDDLAAHRFEGAWVTWQVA